MAQTSLFYVPQARPDPINNSLLEKLIPVAEDARHSLASEAEAEWLLSVTGPLFRELLQRRQVMESMKIAMPIDNVISLPAVR